VKAGGGSCRCCNFQLAMHLKLFLYFSGHITELPPCISRIFRLNVSKVSSKSFEPFGEKATYIDTHAVVASCKC
jgi:hypothetical protein